MEVQYINRRSTITARVQENLSNILSILEDTAQQAALKAKAKAANRRFKCKYCGKDFSEKYNVDQHIVNSCKAIPVGDFECVKCYARFFTEYELTLHKNTHLGLKPYKCDHCDKRFGNPVTLKNHTYAQHKDLVDLPASKRQMPIHRDRCENPECGESDYKTVSCHVAKTRECREYYIGVYKKSIHEIFAKKRKDRWIRPKGFYKKVHYLSAMSEDAFPIKKCVVEIREKVLVDSDFSLPVYSPLPADLDCPWKVKAEKNEEELAQRLTTHIDSNRPQYELSKTVDNKIHVEVSRTVDNRTPMEVSEALAKVIGVQEGELCTGKEVFKRFWNYLFENKLMKFEFESDNSKKGIEMCRPDETLCEVFGEEKMKRSEVYKLVNRNHLAVPGQEKPEGWGKASWEVRKEKETVETAIAMEVSEALVKVIGTQVGELCTSKEVFKRFWNYLAENDLMQFEYKTIMSGMNKGGTSKKGVEMCRPDENLHKVLGEEKMNRSAVTRLVTRNHLAVPGQERPEGWGKPGPLCPAAARPAWRQEDGQQKEPPGKRNKSWHTVTLETEGPKKTRKVDVETPMEVSEALAKVIGTQTGELCISKEVFRRIWNYLTENNLMEYQYDKVTSGIHKGRSKKTGYQVCRSDDTLQELFGVEKMKRYEVYKVVIKNHLAVPGQDKPEGWGKTVWEVKKEKKKEDYIKMEEEVRPWKNYVRNHIEGGQENGEGGGRE